MRRIATGLLLLFAFAVPWEYSLDLGEPLGNVARILGVLVLLAAVPAVLAARSIRRPGALQWLVLALYLVFALSNLWTIDSAATLEKIRAYLQVMMVVWIAWEFARTTEDLRWLLRAFVAGCWVLALLTLLDLAAASTDPNAMAAEQIRFVAEGQDPNDVARFLDLGFPFAALLFATEGSLLLRFLALGYLPAGLLAVLLTASRGGFSAALAAIVGSSLLLVSWKPRAAAVLLASVGGAAGIVWAVVPEDTVARLATIPEQFASSDFNDRFGIWVAGFRAFRQAPWLGYGAGTYAAASGLAPADTAHNTAMAVLVTGGIAAFGIALGIVVVLMCDIARTAGVLRIALGTALLVWVATSMVGSVEENRATWLLFAIINVAGRLAVEDAAELTIGEAAALGKFPAPQRPRRQRGPLPLL